MFDDLIMEQVKNENVTFTFDELKGLMEAMYDDGLLAGARAYGDMLDNLDEATDEIKKESKDYKENSDLLASLVVISKSF